MCIRPKGRTQCIFPRSQHSCLYVYIYSPKVNLYQVVVGQQSVRTLLGNFFCKCFKNNFVLYFLPFQINTKIFIFVILFYKMAAGGHFGCPKITFDRISGHFRSIRNLNLFYIFVCELFLQNGCSGYFGCPKITFGRISGHFRSIRNFFLNFVYKLAAVGHFGCLKFTLDRISYQINTTI